MCCDSLGRLLHVDDQAFCFVVAVCGWAPSLIERRESEASAITECTASEKNLTY
jgi:hypothetical protein